MIYQKRILWYYKNTIFVQFWNIAVLLGHQILLCITKKLKKSKEEHSNWLNR